jgi:predicted nucleic acid-binding protein
LIVAALVDSNVLIDIAFRDPVWADWSKTAIVATAMAHELIINQIIFAELSYRYESYKQVDELLPTREFRREEIPYMAAFAASKAFLVYRKSGGAKERPLPDFLIGAHAAVCGHHIITRDTAGYRTYFPMVELITPETHPFGRPFA